MDYVMLLSGVGSNVVSELWNGLQLTNALKDMIDGVKDQIGTLLPIGITLMFVLAVPRIVKRIVHTFL